MPRQRRSVKNKAEIKCVAVYQSRTLLMILLRLLLCNASIICSRPLCSASKRSESKGRHEKSECAKTKWNPMGTLQKYEGKKKYCEMNKGCILQKWLSLSILTGMIWFPKINWETSRFCFGDEKKASKDCFVELEIQRIDLYAFVLLWLEFLLQGNKLKIPKLKES